MRGMRVCEWTQQELTFDIRFMGGDYDPRRPGRKGEKDGKAKANGRDRRWREKAGRVEQMPWNEMRCLISPGWVRSDRWTVWSHVEPVKAPPSCTEHNVIRGFFFFITICICHAVTSTNVEIYLFSPQVLWETNSLNLTLVCTLCPKLSLGRAWLNLQMPVRLSFSFILIDALGTANQYLPADTK